MPATAVSANVNTTDIFLSNSTHLAFGVDGSGNANSHIVFDGTDFVFDSGSDAASGGGILLRTGGSLSATLDASANFYVEDGYFQSRTGTFAVASAGTTTQVIAVPEGTWLVTVFVSGTNMETRVTAVVHSETNLVSGVTELQNNNFTNGTGAIQPQGGTGGQYGFDPTRDEAIQFVMTGDGVASRTATYRMLRLA